MYEDTNFTVSLPTSAAWDRTLGWFVNTGRKSVFEIAGESTSWGNYVNSQYTLTTGGYQFNNEYIDITEISPLVKAKGEKKKLETGSSDLFCVNNIFDLAGNVAEWVLSNSNDDVYGICRGGYYGNSLSWVPIDTQASVDDEKQTISYNGGYFGGDVGFRAAIFL